MRAAAAFLTAFGGSATPSPQALRWFPVVGAGLGFALGGVWWAAGLLWPPAVAAAAVVAVDLGLTGMLHLDGLVDAADGLLPPLGTAERRLEVMATPDVGAFGVGTATTVVLLRWTALAVLAPSVGLLAGLWCASRTLMATTAQLVPYARPHGGLATAFLGSPGKPSLRGEEEGAPGRPAEPDRPSVRSSLAGGRGSRLRRRGRPPARTCNWWVALGGLTVAVGLAGPVGDGWGGVRAVTGVVLGGAGVVSLARRRIGGFTGDVLGAAGVVGETAGLLVAAARW